MPAAFGAAAVLRAGAAPLAARGVGVSDKQSGLAGHGLVPAFGAGPGGQQKESRRAAWPSAGLDWEGASSVAAAISQAATGPACTPPVLGDEQPPAIPDAVDYGTLLEEYPPLVRELVTAYPLTTIKQMAAAVQAAAAPSYAEQMDWPSSAGLTELSEGDVLHHMRAAASA